LSFLNARESYRFTVLQHPMVIGVTLTARCAVDLLIVFTMKLT